MLQALAIAALSFALHAASLWLAPDRASPSFDPIVGVLLAAWVRWPFRRWAEIAVAVLAGGAAFATLSVDRLTLGAPHAVALDTVGAAAAALALRGLAPDSLCLGRVRDVWLFVGVAALGTGLSALGSAALDGAIGGNAGLRFRDAWASTLLGALMIAPLLLVFRDGRVRDTLATWRARLELVVVGCAVVAAAWATYFSNAPVSLPRGIPALLMVWAAFRLRSRGAAIAIPLLGATVLSSMGTQSLATIPSLGTGPIVSTWEIEAFLALSFVTSLVLAALSEERALLIEHLEREVNVLRGLLPICAHCKKIRDAESRWHPIESYIQRHSEATFSHGICPACLETHYGDLLRRPN